MGKNLRDTSGRSAIEKTQGNKNLMKIKIILQLILCLLLLACSDNSDKDYDLIIKNGIIYDGSGENPFYADIAVNGSYIEKIGDLSNYSSKKLIDADGLAVAPGFINMLS